MVPEKNSSVYIQSFKHDGTLYRTWDQGFVIESDENHYVLVTNKTWVIEKTEGNGLPGNRQSAISTVIDGITLLR